MAIVIKTKDYLSKLKKVENNNFDKIIGYLHFGEELSITNVVDVVNDIHIYEYAPMISFLELSDLVKNIEHHVPQFKPFIKCVHYHLFKIILEQDSEGEDRRPYVLKDALVLILKRPYALMLKFGNVTNINYVIQLDSQTALYMLESKTCTYKDEYYRPMESQQGVIVAELQNLSVEGMLQKTVHVRKEIAEQNLYVKRKMNEDIKIIKNAKDEAEELMKEIRDGMVALREKDEAQKEVANDISSLFLIPSSANENKQAPKKKGFSFI